MRYIILKVNFIKFNSNLIPFQVVSIAAGLPYTIVLNFMCIALWRSIKVEAGEKDPNGPEWSVPIMDSFHRLKNIPTILLCIIAPWFFLGRAYGKLNNCKPIFSMIVMAFLFYTTFILQIAEIFHHGLAYIGWAIYFGFATYGCGIRVQMREEYAIDGKNHFLYCKNLKIFSAPGF